MTDIPEGNLQEPAISPAEGPAAAEKTDAPLRAEWRSAAFASPETAQQPPAGSPPGERCYEAGYRPPGEAAPTGRPALFQSWVQPPARPPARIPQFGDLALLFALILLGLVVTGILWAIAVHQHLFGVSTLQGSMNEIHYLLGSEVVLYFVTFAECLLIFPLFWHKNLLVGLHWNGSTALRLRWWLAGAAFACFLLAVLNEVLVPGPTNAPIEKIFRTPGAAWLLFGFGVTIAPFFEETFFRGFLLPSFCTAFDWLAEVLTSQNPGPWPVQGRPKWPLSARLFTAFVMAIPIAAICAYPRSGHYRIRLLVVVIWSLALTFVWAITKSELGKISPRFTTVDSHGNPVWSISAMAVGSLLASVPFALLHAQQTGYSIGPFLLLVGVSLVLCAVRLSTRSLASSVVVHACYNFFLFSLMFIGTGGFRHMDKM